MRRDDIGELMALVAVAEERSFTRAAARLGTSQSNLSATIRKLEDRVGLKLLNRTTRSVAPTEAGDRLLAAVGPAFDQVGAALTALNDLRDKPAGSFRITASDHAADTLLIPALARFLPEYPDISVEICVDYGLTDIVADRFDAGVRLGEHLAAGMIAVRIGPSMRMAAVAAPSYLEGRAAIEDPQDLMRHACINLRLPTYGGVYSWEFERDGREQRVRVGGQLVFNAVPQILNAALAGLGIAYVPDDLVETHVAQKRLVRVLDAWSPPFAGYHLYYPSRREQEPAFNLMVEALRWRG